MSRATVDLQAVRFFLGYGLVLIVQAALTILLAAIAMFVLDPRSRWSRCRRCRSSSGSPHRYSRRSRPALQEVQQRIAELTADVEENVGGVRVVKAFAREERQLQRFDHSVARVFDAVDDLDAAARVLQPVHRLPAATSASRRCCSSAAAR